MQTELRDLERKKKTLRQEIFEVEDEIEERRDEMINAIKQRCSKQSMNLHFYNKMETSLKRLKY